MERTSGIAEINGARLAYETAGSGTPLVLLHGFTLDMRTWDDQIEALTRHYHVIRYDLRGYGKSSPATRPYAHIDDLKALLDHFGINRPIILGQSMGGQFAVDFALAYPEATRALVVVDPALGGYHFRPELSESLGAIYAVARRQGVEVAKREWLAHPLFALAMERPAVARRLAQMVNDYSGWHYVNEDPGRQLEPPAADRLAEITAPTLVLVGEREIPGFRDVSDVVAERVRGARQVVLMGIGHMANMEDPEQFNEVLLRSLAEMTRG
jgi:pimeloyl-ACP methyl ester carboxylesterase